MELIPGIYSVIWASWTEAEKWKNLTVGGFAIFNNKLYDCWGAAKGYLKDGDELNEGTRFVILNQLCSSYQQVSYAGPLGGKDDSGQ